MKFTQHLTLTIISYLVGMILSYGQSIRVMTYNIKFDDKKDTVNGWEMRKEHVIGLISYHNPDIVGTQEGLRHQLEDIKTALPQLEYLGAARDDGKEKGEYTAIYFNKNKFREVRSGTFWLSPSQDRPSKGWDAALPRICTWAEMKTRDSGVSLFVFNTHFDHVGKLAREKSVDIILKKIQEVAKDNPVILMGDFNFTPESTPYAQMTLADSKRIAQKVYGPEATFNGFNFTRKPDRRIDYIFVGRSIDVLHHAVLTDSQDLKYPSDHFPVIADLRIYGLDR